MKKQPEGNILPSLKNARTPTKYSPNKLKHKGAASTNSGRLSKKMTQILNDVSYSSLGNNTSTPRHTRTGNNEEEMNSRSSVEFVGEVSSSEDRVRNNKYIDSSKMVSTKVNPAALRAGFPKPPTLDSGSPIPPPVGSRDTVTPGFTTRKMVFEVFGKLYKSAKTIGSTGSGTGVHSHGPVESMQEQVLDPSPIKSKNGFAKFRLAGNIKGTFGRKEQRPLDPTASAKAKGELPLPSFGSVNQAGLVNNGESLMYGSYNAANMENKCSPQKKICVLVIAIIVVIVLVVIVVVVVNVRQNNLEEALEEAQEELEGDD